MSSLLCVGLLLLPQLGGLPLGFGETETFDRVSPSGAHVLHVEMATVSGSGPGRAVLVRDGEIAWSRTLPFTLAEAIVDDDGFVAGYGWPGGRPIETCIDEGPPSAFGVLALDPQGRIVRERVWPTDGPLVDRIEPPYGSRHAGAFAWIDDLVRTGAFARARKGERIPVVRRDAQPDIRTVQIRGTPLRALAWRVGERTRLLVVDGDFEPSLATTLGERAVLRSLAGGWLVVEEDEESAYALRFERAGDGWSFERAGAAELAALELADAQRAREVWVPHARVSLGGSDQVGGAAPWQASCVLQDGRVVATEWDEFVAHVFEASTGDLVASASAPSELVRGLKRPSGTSLVRAPAGGFRIRWARWTNATGSDAMPYVRYDASGSFSAVEDRLDRRWAAVESWLPFGSRDERWVVSMGGLRLWNGEAWAGPAVEHDAWGRWLDQPFREGDQVLASMIRATSAVENGDAIVLVSRGPGFVITLVPREGQASRTVPLPAGIEPSWGARIAWDGTHAYLTDGARGLVVLDTRDDSVRRVAIEGLDDLSAVDVHFVPETNELWIVDRDRHELLRFAL